MLSPSPSSWQGVTQVSVSGSCGGGLLIRQLFGQLGKIGSDPPPFEVLLTNWFCVVLGGTVRMFTVVRRWTVPMSETLPSTAKMAPPKPDALTPSPVELLRKTFPPFRSRIALLNWAFAPV